MNDTLTQRLLDVQQFTTGSPCSRCENTARRCCVYAFSYYPQVAKNRINAGFIHLFLLSPLATGRERGYTSMQVSALAKFNPNQSPKTGAVLHHYMKK